MPLEVARPQIVLGFNPQVHNAPAYQISTKSGNAQLSCWWFTDDEKVCLHCVWLQLYVILVFMFMTRRR